MMICLLFSAKSFMGLALMFSLLIYFELIFIWHEVEIQLQWFCVWKYSWHNTICWRDSSFFHCVYFMLFKKKKNNGPQMYEFLSGLLVLCQCCFDYCSPVVNFEIRMYESSNFVLFQSCLGYFGVPSIPNEFEGWLLHFCNHFIKLLN
jgi:hypothetical protein